MHPKARSPRCGKRAVVLSAAAHESGRTDRDSDHAGNLGGFRRLRKRPSTPRRSQLGPVPGQTWSHRSLTTVASCNPTSRTSLQSRQGRLGGNWNELRLWCCNGTRNDLSHGCGGRRFAEGGETWSYCRRSGRANLLSVECWRASKALASVPTIPRSWSNSTLNNSTPG